MAAVKDVQPEFFGQPISPMRAFARDEGVHAFGDRQLQFTASAAGDHSDATTDPWASRDDRWHGAHGLVQALLKFRPRHPRARGHAEVLLLGIKERLEIPQAERR